MCTLGFAQPNSNEGFVLIDGLVSGYYYEPTRKLLQKERAVVLEGTLERVMMNVFESGALLHTVYTNKKGEFNFKLPLGKFYKIELTKNGRAKTVFLVDVQSVSNEIMVIGLRFNGAEIAMNRFVSKDTADANLPIGRLYFDSRKQMMEFEVNQPKNKGGLFSKRDETNPCISVMKRTVLKNKDNVATDEKAMEEYIKQAVKQKIDKLTGKGKKKSKFDATRKKEENNSAADSVNNISNVQKSRLIDLDPDIRLFTEGDISSRERAINAARKQLEKDKANAVSME
ncbi:MAG: hypothetical protein IT235_05715, partial [Bacteroidia bacterium]|nr:hypothetical protein [Bacteroidia bacterium]